MDIEQSHLRILCMKTSGFAVDYGQAVQTLHTICAALWAATAFISCAPCVQPPSKWTSIACYSIQRDFQPFWQAYPHHTLEQENHRLQKDILQKHQMLSTAAKCNSRWL